MKELIDDRAICESELIGSGSRVEPLAVVRRGASVGRNAHIQWQSYLGEGVSLGDEVQVGVGARLDGLIAVGDDVRIGVNATFVGNAKRPITVGRGASIGPSATVLAANLGAGCVVNPGAVVMGDVPPNAIVAGVPARIIGYVDASAPAQPSSPAQIVGAPSLSVGGASFHTLRLVRDLRGSLSVGEFAQDLPFLPKRYFIVFDVPTEHVRGEHAHRQCHQFLICVKGSCAVMIDDGSRREEVTLDQPNVGIYIPPMVWGVQYKYSSDAVLLVFASEHYEAGDYIRDYEQFLKEKSDSAGSRR